MVTDFSTLEKLYARGVLDINGKDFINDTNSNIQINSNRDYFIPDNRFAPVDQTYIRNQIDKDTFTPQQQTDNWLNPQSQPFQPTYSQNPDNVSNKVLTKAKTLLGNNITTGIIGSIAILCVGKYAINNIPFLKTALQGCRKTILNVLKYFYK